MAHRNARLTAHGRRLLIQRVIGDARPVAHVAEELGTSRATGYKWVARWRTEGDAGLADRPSTAHRLPGKTPAEVETRICALRTTVKHGPRRLAGPNSAPRPDSPAARALFFFGVTALICTRSDGALSRAR